MGEFSAGVLLGEMAQMDSGLAAIDRRRTGLQRK